MRRHLWLASACAGMLGIGAMIAVCQARQGVVRTKAGLTIDGDVTEKDDSVVIVSHGVQTVINRDDLLSVSYPADFDQQFKERLAKLDAKDVKGRIELARWAFDNRQYPLARDVLDQAQGIDPNNADANQLMTTVQTQIRLERSANTGTPATPVTPALGGPTTPAVRPADRRYLSPADVNSIRQAELQASDVNVTFRFENDVIRRYVAAAGGTLSDFNALPQLDKALRVLQYGDPKMRPDVRVVGEPGSILAYKRDVQPTVLQGCAAVGCHSAGSGGTFQLYNPPEGDAASISNFYILQTYAKNIPGSGNVPLIDRAHPEQSMLLEYGLPTEVAQFRHPQAANWRPAFRSRSDPKYLMILAWVRDALSPVPPRYDVSYALPGAAAPTTAPTTATSRPTH